MKLWNVTSAIALGALFAFGCSVENTTPTTDGGTTETGTDTGVKVDTGTVVTDSGTASETAAETGLSCMACQSTRCAAEEAACKSTPEKLKGCNDLAMCLSLCKDTACGDKCVSDSMSSEGKDLLTCVLTKCKTECGG